MVRWHLSLGFDAIVVFLNNTTDGSRAVLESMHDSRIVIVQFDYHAAPVVTGQTYKEFSFRLPAGLPSNSASGLLLSTSTNSLFCKVGENM